jgi:hypothetical protein
LMSERAEMTNEELMDFAERCIASSEVHQRPTPDPT